jgi:RHS repeat-associated protein
MPVVNYHTVNGQMVGQSTGSTFTQYLTDALGSVTATVNGKRVTNTYRYKPYGERLAKTGAGADPDFQWTGDTGSRVTGRSRAEQYNRARHNGTTQASWTSVDPIWPIEPPYAYVRSRPVSQIDPTGLQSNYGAIWPSFGHPCCVPKCSTSGSPNGSDLGGNVPSRMVPTHWCDMMRVALRSCGLRFSTDDFCKMMNNCWSQAVNAGIDPTVACAVGLIELGRVDIADKLGGWDPMMRVKTGSFGCTQMFPQTAKREAEACKKCPPCRGRFGNIIDSLERLGTDYAIGRRLEDHCAWAVSLLVMAQYRFEKCRGNQPGLERGRGRTPFPQIPINFPITWNPGAYRNDDLNWGYNPNGFESAVRMRCALKVIHTFANK